MTDELKKEDKAPVLPHTIKLRFPFDIGEGAQKTQKTEIVFKRFPKAILGLPLMSGELTHGHYMPALCSMTDEPDFVFKLMCHGDYTTMVDFAANFF